MKAAFAMAATAAVAGANAAHHRRHDQHHGMFEGINKRGGLAETCDCTTVYSTYYGTPTLSFPPAPPPTSTTTSTSTGTITTTVTPTPTTPPAVTVPTPIAHTCETPGTYTFPATTVVITETTNACVPESTPLPSGTHTYGGVTTVVTTATTVTCPYATVTTTNGVETSVVETTTYVCPSEGTYTIAPTTTVCDSDTTVTYPVVTEYPPGTYTAPAVITTVVDTNTVVYCPFDTPTPTPVPTTEAPPAPKPTTTEAPPAPKPTTTKLPPKPYPTGKPDTGLGGTPGKPWGTTFTPYLPNGECMSQTEVSLAIAAMSAIGLKSIRTYSTDCNTLEYVGQACKEHGIQMMVGIYIDQPHCSASNPTISEQINALKSWGAWDLVPLVVVGNEAGLNGFCTPGELAGLIEQCRSEFTGYTGPFTTADTVNMWQQTDYAAALCPAVDVVGANAHAFFDLGTTAPEAGQFVQSQLDLLDNVCSGKKSYILESGWPSAGNSQGLAVPGFSQQIQAINSIIETCGDRVMLFSLFNDSWKSGDTSCACEQHFGCASVLGITLPSILSG